MQKQELVSVTAMQNKLNITKDDMNKLKIGNTEYKLKVVKSFEDETYIGLIEYADKVITLSKYGGISKRRLHPSAITETFWHEVTHGILKDMRSKLHNNEAFVENFSVRLTQVLKQVYSHERSMVTQCIEGLRKLPPKVPRSPSAKKAQVRGNRADKIRGTVPQSSGRLLKRKAPTKRV
jgi:hypothetical protein